MTIYVDDAFIPARVGRLSARWCHLTADTKTELHDFAQQIGLRRAWFQDKPGGRWHYDVNESFRAKAVMRGAVPIAFRDMPSITRACQPACRCAPEADSDAADAAALGRIAAHEHDIAPRNAA